MGEEEVGVVLAAAVAVMGAAVVAALSPLGPLEGRGLRPPRRRKYILIGHIQEFVCEKSKRQ